MARKEDTFVGHLKKFLAIYLTLGILAGVNIYFEREVYISIITMSLGIHENKEDIEKVSKAFDKFKNVANQNFRVNDFNSQIRQKEVTKFILQGQLDTVNRVIESRPNDELEPYRQNRDNYMGQIATIDTAIEDLKKQF